MNIRIVKEPQRRSYKSNDLGSFGDNPPNDEDNDMDMDFIPVQSKKGKKKIILFPIQFQIPLVRRTTMIRKESWKRKRWEFPPAPPPPTTTAVTALQVVKTIKVLEIVINDSSQWANVAEEMNLKIAKKTEDSSRMKFDTKEDNSPRRICNTKKYAIRCNQGSHQKTPSKHGCTVHLRWPCEIHTISYQNHNTRKSVRNKQTNRTRGKCWKNWTNLQQCNVLGVKDMVTPDNTAFLPKGA